MNGGASLMPTYAVLAVCKHAAYKTIPFIRAYSQKTKPSLGNLRKNVPSENQKTRPPLQSAVCYDFVFTALVRQSDDPLSAMYLEKARCEKY